MGACESGIQYCDELGAWAQCLGEVLPATEDCTTETDEDCDGSAQCTGAFLWSRAVGTNTSNPGVRSIATTPRGHMVAAGMFNDSVDFDGDVHYANADGNFDMFVAVIDPFTDQFTWSRSFGGPGLDRANSVAVTPTGEVLMAGYASAEVDFGGVALDGPGGAFLAKLDTNGGLQWVRSFGSSSPQRVSIDAEGNVALVGRLFGVANFGGSDLGQLGSAIAVVKLDADGNHLWSSDFGLQTTNNYAIEGATDAAGNIHVALELEQDMVDFGAGPIPHRDDVDVYIAKFDPDGNLLWGKSAVGKPYQINNTVTGMTVDSQGHVVIVDGFEGSIDFGAPQAGSGVAIARFDPEGDLVWSRIFDGLVESWHAAADENGNVLIAGTFYEPFDFGGGPLEGNVDAFVVKYDASGEHVWSHAFGASEWTHGTHVTTDATGAVFVSGLFVGDLAIGEEQYSSQEGATVFTKLAP